MAFIFDPLADISCSSEAESVDVVAPIRTWNISLLYTRIFDFKESGKSAQNRPEKLSLAFPSFVLMCSM